MKQPLLLSVLLCLSVIGLAQVPPSFNYQTIVRSNSGETITNQSVAFKISILENSDTGTPIYVETHQTETNAFGLATLKIGDGDVQSGTFSPNDWGSARHFVKVELDATGGSVFVNFGTSEFSSVPYAFHAQTVENDKVDDADHDPENEIQSISISGTQLSLSDGGGTVTLPSSGGGDNWGTQTVESDATLSGNGTTASPLSADGDLTDDQTLSISGNDLSISGGNTIALPPSDNPWTSSTAGIKYTSGKVGINWDPLDDEAMLQIGGGTFPAIEAMNSSATYPAIFAQNNSGNAAYFQGPIHINDGTQGDGKVLTSDADGSASWQTPSTSPWTREGDDILFTGDRVGIGSIEPSYAQNLQIVKGMGASGIFKSTGSSAYLDIDRPNTDNTSQVIFGTAGNRNFRVGLFRQSANFRITTENSSLNGIEVSTGGNLEVTKDIKLGGEVNVKSNGTANMLPHAYACVLSNQNMATRTPNVTSSVKLGTGQYKISVNDLEGENYIVVVTVNQGVAYLNAVVTSKNSDYFVVAIWDTKNDAYYDGGFSFIVYKI